MHFYFLSVLNPKKQPVEWIIFFRWRSEGIIESTIFHLSPFPLLQFHA
jgi:hypothetical protein